MARSVGILSFFPAFNPPRSGGELRLRHIALGLARRGYDVQMAAPTYGDAAEETVEHHPNFHERRFPRTHDYNKAHHLLDRFAGFKECSGLVCSLVARRHRALRAEAERVARHSDILTHESPFLAPLAPRPARRGQLFVYNSYNVEARMARDMFGAGLAGRLATRRIRSLEGALLRESHIVLACGQEDADFFVSDYRIDASKIVVVPNGVDVQAIAPPATDADRAAAREVLGLSRSRPACFFIGSYHPPNLEAVEIIVARLAPAFPGVDFLIAGKACQASAERAIPANVRLLGLIDEETKSALLHGTDLALNPMVSGSGTNLKMLEYLAAGLPVLTTPHGARGLALEHRRTAAIVPIAEWPAAIDALLSDAPQRRILAEEGRAHAVARFSWKAIAETVADLYTLKSGRRIVILNDYPVSPVEAGGQVRIDAVARHLSDAGLGVTVLTLSTAKAARRVSHGPRFEELNIPRSGAQRFADGVLHQLMRLPLDDASALVFANALCHSYRRTIRREIATASSVMLSHPYLEPLTRRLRGLPLFYDSHNTENALKEALLEDGILARRIVAIVANAERRATRRARAIFCVSEENRRDLLRLEPSMEDRALLCPNGVDTAAIAALDPPAKLALRRKAGMSREIVAIFVGSQYLPNVAAARLIIDELAPEFPRVLFAIVGSVCQRLGSDLPENVLAFGAVPASVKRDLLQLSDIALNPVETGSGSSLKLFEYLAAGLPTITTHTGARGLPHGAHGGLAVVEADGFAFALRQLLRDRHRRAALSAAARAAAEMHCDWKTTLAPMVETLTRDGE